MTDKIWEVKKEIDSEENQTREGVSKEMQGIFDAIEKYCKKHNDDVILNFSICAFEGPECKVVDDRYWFIGDKETLLIDNSEMRKEIKKLKE